MVRTVRGPMLVACRLSCLAAGLAAPLAAQGRIVEDSVRSPALEGNLLGDGSVRRLRVYLPPSYDADPTRRYPVLYLLHGFGGSPDSWSNGSYSGFDLARAMDSLAAGGTIHEFLVVMPDGRNVLGGSVFANSAATGNWETYLVRDVARHVDATYRTLRRGRSRGIAGHSMGAAAALRLAMRYPAGFAAVYAQSPNALLPCQGLGPGAKDSLLGLSRRSQFDSLGGSSRLCLGYAAAWSPDSARAPFFADLPFSRQGGEVVADSTVLERWRAWMLLDMAPRYRDGLVRLRGIAFDVGGSDPYAPGVEQLDSLFTRLRVRHQFERYDGDHHSAIGERMITRVLPFFSGMLDFGPEAN
jgi:S-formylglutathione hydrolase FrmB